MIIDDVSTVIILDITVNLKSSQRMSVKSLSLCYVTQ